MYFNDPYEDILKENVIYTTKNIPTNGTEDAFNEIFTNGCECVNFCTLDSCSCMQKYGINYSINKDTLCTNYILNTEQRNGLFECNESCKCKHKICGNRLVQFGPRHHLEIKNCAEKGLGLFTNKKILKGNFICEYAGEIITNSEAVKRFKHNKEQNLMNYIMCLQEYFGEETKSTFIDPMYFGNIGRYLNHSCNPNCELIPVRTNCIVPKLCIFAKNHIEDNSELTFDYGDGTNNIISDNDIELKPCFCKEVNCRKFMPYNANIGK